MTSLATIKRWTDLYSFNEPEIEILLRCVEAIPKESEGDSSFINILAHSSPHAFFFLPCDELKNRTVLCETLLPKGFGERLKEFVLSAKKETIYESIIPENFLRGISLCCRGSSHETLQVIFKCACNEIDGEYAKPADLINLCFQLSLSSQVLTNPIVDDEFTLVGVDPVGCHFLTKSLIAVADENELVNLKAFTDWASSTVPEIATTMATFVQNLIFHGKLEKKTNFDPFAYPKLEDTSDFFQASDPSLLFIFRSMSRDLSGKVSSFIIVFLSMEPTNIHDGTFSGNVYTRLD